MAMRPAALGYRAHSGWAALVVVSGDRKTIEVVDRRRIPLADDEKLSGSVQPYHAAEGKKLREAAALIGRFEASARRLAVQGQKAVADDIAKKGYAPVRAAILLASGRPLPELESILASHALIHTADGEHFRSALGHACEEGGIPVTRIRERELAQRAEEELKRPSAELIATVAALGRSVGPPWTQDQKLAALAGWVALAR
ncbi:MAG TPA: hypothetical protein VGL15_00070 [Vicinamibacteria bacterium]